MPRKYPACRPVAAPRFRADDFYSKLKLAFSRQVLVLPVVVMGVAGVVPIRAASLTWDGGGGDGIWNTATNWSGDQLPGSADTVQFTGAVASNATISLGASQVIKQLQINSYSGVNSFTIGSAADILAGYTLTLTNVYRADNNGNTQTIAANVVLAGDSNWNLVKGYNGTMAVTGSIGSASDVTLTKDGGMDLILSGNNTFTGAIRVFGAQLFLSGTNAYAGTTTVSGGNLILSFGAATATNIVNNASTLMLGGIRGGGNVTVTGRNLANVVNSQTFNGVTLDAGASTLTVNNGISSGNTLVALGAITRHAGSALNFVQPTTNATLGAQNGFTTTTGNDASGILGAYATVGGTEYATNNGTNIVAYAGYTDQAGNTMADSPTTNLRITSGTTGNITQNAGTTTVNTIRVNDDSARTLTVGAGNTLRANGVLATGAGGLTIGEAANAGTLTAGLADNTAAELVINNTTAVGVNSVIADNGSGAVALTKTGAGTLTLNAASTYTGGTYVDAGTLALTAGSTNPLSTVGGITVAGGTLSLGTGTSQTTSGVVVLAGGTLSGGSITKSGANYDFRNGTVSTQLAGSAGLDKTTSGTLSLSNTTSNTFTGDTTITEGSVIGGAAANVISISGNLIVGSASGGNAASYFNSGSHVSFNHSNSVTVYSNGSVDFGSGAQNLDNTVNIVGGSITGTQIYQNVTVNMTGGSWGGTTYGNINSFTTNASADTAAISANLRGGQGIKTFTVADGAAATDLLLTGDVVSGNVAKAGAGLMASSGSKSYSGSTTINGGTLSVNTLANGGVSSGVGSSSNAATSLVISGGVLQYTGSGASTDRLFTIGTTSGSGLDASGTGAVNFTNTGSYVLSGSNTARTVTLSGTSAAANTLSGVLGDNGTGKTSIAKSGAGEWVLGGANTYTGATTIGAGTLALGVNNAIAAGSAITLTAGTFDLQSFSTSAASLSFNAGSTLKFNLGMPGNATALLALTGNFDPSGTGGAYTLDFSGSGQVGTYNLVSYAGTFFGDQSDFTVTNLGAGLAGTLTLNSNSLVLSVVASAIPEPSTYALLAGGLVLAGAAWRSRRRRA